MRLNTRGHTCCLRRGGDYPCFASAPGLRQHLTAVGVKIHAIWHLLVKDGAEDVWISIPSVTRAGYPHDSPSKTTTEITHLAFAKVPVEATEEVVAVLILNILARLLHMGWLDAAHRGGLRPPHLQNAHKCLDMSAACTCDELEYGTGQRERFRVQIKGP